MERGEKERNNVRRREVGEKYFTIDTTKSVITHLNQCT